VEAFDTNCAGVADGRITIEGNGGNDPGEIFNFYVFNAANNIVLQGDGAAIYQGAPGDALAIGNSSQITLDGLTMVGFAGGTLSASRERDKLIGIYKNSKNITIDGCYITNSIGYTAYTVGDPNVAGGGSSETCLNITIRNSTLKTRHGNGVKSSLGGSQSLWAFAFVDSQNIVIQNNIIYGTLDFEPNNVAGQSTYGIFVDGNQFPAGYVTPIVPAGVSTYWADEPIGKSNSGGTPIVGSVTIGGALGAPVNGFNVVSNNSFDHGLIIVSAGVYFYWVLNNSFRLGKINVGAAGFTSRFYNVSGNTAREVLDATNGFIVFTTGISDSQFNNNSLLGQDLPVISWDGVAGADLGGNNYVGNSSLLGITDPVINIPTGLADTSRQIGTKGAQKEIQAFTTSLTDGTNSATLSSDQLYYRIEGRQITFTTRIFITSAGSIGSDSYIVLPTLSNSQGGMRYVVNVTTEQNFSPSANFTGLYGLINENSDKCFIKQMLSTGVPTGVAAANFSSNATLIVSGSYYLE
jgi:hypothetical protein